MWSIDNLPSKLFEEEQLERGITIRRRTKRYYFQDRQAASMVVISFIISAQALGVHFFTLSTAAEKLNATDPSFLPLFIFVVCVVT